jgi:GNAT superfamily N-acetyltransferase
MPLLIRPARPDERAAVSALTLRAYAEYAAVMAPAGWAALDAAVRAALAAEAPAERIVAARVEDGALAGSVMLFPPAADAYGGLAGAMPWPELRLLAVPPESRGLGIGPRLVHECVRRARAMGAPALGLHTSRSMTTAVAMYERMGFVRAPAHDFQPAGSELVTGYVLHLEAGGAVPVG